MKINFFGLFIMLFGVLVIVFLDFDLYNTICKFGGLSAYFAKNPFAGSAIVAVALFNFSLPPGPLRVLCLCETNYKINK